MRRATSSMAPINLNAQHAAQIDGLLWDIYGRKLGGTELRQLARLFEGSHFPKALGTILSSALPPAGKYYRVELEVSVAWIDKHPLALLQNRTRRVELGDAALFYFPILKSGSYKHYRKARAVLLQAKVAKAQKQLAAPSVPVNPPAPRKNSSTELELELLSHWAPFDLFKASASAQPLVKQLTLPPAGSPPAYAWFMATPRSSPTPPQSAAWKSPWMCGPAANGAACDTPLGALMARFFDASWPPVTGSVDSGVDFDFNPAHIANPDSSGKGWARLCHELLRLAGTRQLPLHLREDPAARPPAISSTTVRSFPYLGFGDSERHPSDFFGLRSLGDAIWRAGFDIVRWLWPRRFPLVIVTSIELEGESAATGAHS